MQLECWVVSITYSLHAVQNMNWQELVPGAIALLRHQSIGRSECNDQYEEQSSGDEIMRSSGFTKVVLRKHLRSSKPSSR